MRYINKAVATIVVAIALLGFGVASAQAASPQEDVVAAVNQIRADANLSSLRRDSSLDAAAQEWAQAMSSSGTFAHSSNEWRAARIPAGWSSHGENIAFGYRTGSAVMTGWMNSDGHRANILRSSFTRIGVGYVASGNYWVQIFAGYVNDGDPRQSAASINAAYSALGGASGPLGEATSEIIAINQNGGGTGQAFRNGSIYWTPATGARAVIGVYRDLYFQYGGAAGSMGWPTSDPLTLAGRPGGGAQAFQRGSIYSSSTTTARAVIGSMRDAYFRFGGATGPLGWPTGESGTIQEKGGGAAQTFEAGSIYASTRGAFVLKGVIANTFSAEGSVAGELGWPTSDAMTIQQNGGGLGQAFSGGSIYSSAKGTYAVSGRALSFYFTLGGSAGSLGWPSGPQSCGSDGSCSQAFQGGTVYLSSAGVRVGDPRIETAYASVAAQLGARASGLLSISQNGGGVAQAFDNGSIYAGNGLNAFAVTGSIRSHYWSVGGSAGPLGWPTASQGCTSGSACSQSFQGGTIFWTSTGGARIGDVRIERLYAANGGAGGSLGPIASGLIQIPQNRGGVAQVFAYASVYAGSGLEAFAVSGGIRQQYFALSGSAGSLGWPLAAQVCASDGSCSQTFQTATIYWSKVEGGRVGDAQIEGVYSSSGGASGPLGVRTSGLITVAENGSGHAQAFAKGSIYVGSDLDAFAVTGKVLSYYWSIGGSAGSLGWPTGSASCTSSGVCTQNFQNGTVTR